MIDVNIAEAWGTTVSPRRGRSTSDQYDQYLLTSAMEAFLSATAEIHNFTLVTRNVSDFPLLKAILNPWA
jgi:predicted nucleic acid-binding protein